jgi:ABC-2 type transport system permease protein
VPAQFGRRTEDPHAPDQTVGERVGWRHGRVLVNGLILLGTFGQSGSLGATWESIARWSPVGAVMTLFAAVLNLSAWDTHDSLTLLACAGYVIVFAAIGIRWFQWDAR